MFTAKKKSTYFILATILALVLFESVIFAESTSKIAYASAETYSTNTQTTSYSSKEVAATYSFSIIDEAQHYVSVRITNKTVATKAVIPSEVEIDNVKYTVTEVAANGFASSTKLKRVTLAKTIKKIGNNAFLNCSALELVYLSNVETIGNYAFMRCTSLERVVIPSTVTSLGSGIFRNNNTVVEVRLAEAPSAWSGTWNTNNTGAVVYNSQYYESPIYEPLYSNTSSQGLFATMADSDTPIGYAYADGQAYAEPFYINDESVKIIPAVNPDDGLPVLEIDMASFMDDVYDTIIVEYSETPINLRNMAFLSCTSDSIIIDRAITLNDDDSEGGVSESVFISTTVTNIVLPNSIPGISNMMFADSTVSKIKFIEPQPCEDYSALVASMPDEVDLPTISSSFFIGESAFDSACNIAQLNVHSNVASIGMAMCANWAATQTIFIDGCAYNGQLINRPEGWESTFLDDCNANVLYSYYRVDVNNTLGTGPLQYIDMPFNSIANDLSDTMLPQKENWKFTGYYSKQDSDGVKFYDEQLKGVGVFNDPSINEIYAHWELATVRVTLNNNDGTTDKQTFLANVTEMMPEGYTAPSRLHYIFGGFYDGLDEGATQYYDADMKSVHICDKQSDFTLYAKWTPIAYTITYENWYGTNPNPSTITIEDFTNNSYTFLPATGEGYITNWSRSSITSTELSDMTLTGTQTYQDLADSYNNGNYEIYTKYQWAQIASLDNGIRSFKVMQNIDLLEADLVSESITNAVPYQISRFRGTLLGNNKTISGVVLNYTAGQLSTMAVSSNSYVNLGLIGWNTGVIKSLTVKGALTVAAGVTNVNVGLLCGRNGGEIDRCTTSLYGSGTYAISCLSTTSYTGGLVGYNTGSINNCINQGKIRAAGDVGGVTGFSGIDTNASVAMSRNSGAIDYVFTGSSTAHSIGGIVGILQEGYVSTCTDYAVISFTNPDNYFSIGVYTNMGLIIGKVISANDTNTRWNNNVMYSTASIKTGNLANTSHCGGEVGYVEPQVGTI